MNELFFAESSAWLTQVGLAGTPEPEIVFGFCERCVAAGLPVARGLVAIDTLDPVHEGRVFRWGYNPEVAAVFDYGRTSQEGLAAGGFNSQDVEAARRWEHSAFYRMMQTGSSLLRRRLNAATKDEFAWVSDLYAEGMTDYVAIINRFATAGVIGEMDGVYSSWATGAPLSVWCRTWRSQSSRYH
jgi:adenylate cyclase